MEYELRIKVAIFVEGRVKENLRNFYFLSYSETTTKYRCYFQPAKSKFVAPPPRQDTNY